MYSIDKDKWTLLTTTPAKPFRTTGAVYQGKLYLFGNPQSNSFFMDPAANTWKPW